VEGCQEIRDRWQQLFLWQTDLFLQSPWSAAPFLFCQQLMAFNAGMNAVAIIDVIVEKFNIIDIRLLGIGKLPVDFIL